MKKIVIIFLSIIAICMLSFNFVGCNNFKKGTEGLQYQKIMGKREYTVTGLGSAEETDIIISARYKGLPVTHIEKAAFANCVGLNSIEIQSSVTSIGPHAFENCSGLTSVVIPNSITSIADGMFARCSSLTSVAIPNSVTSIGSSAFCDCSSLTSIEIPNRVTEIGRYAFACCYSLTSITIPNSVTVIGPSAFYYCTNLKTIYYTGTQEQWDSIKKDSDWDTCTGDYTIIYNYTGE